MKSLSKIKNSFTKTLKDLETFSRQAEEKIDVNTARMIEIGVEQDVLYRELKVATTMSKNIRELIGEGQ